jgi:hypothetical protein
MQALLLSIDLQQTQYFPFCSMIIWRNWRIRGLVGVVCVYVWLTFYNMSTPYCCTIDISMREGSRERMGEGRG